jgi:hypothetical protein
MAAIFPARRTGGRRSIAPLAAQALAVTAVLALSACQQKMAYQPKYLPLAASNFFADGRAARPQVEDTVAHGSMDDDYLNVSADSNQFPLPLTRAVLERGRQRYNIYCAPCHGLAGDGDGIIVQRGFRHPPSFHIDRLRNSPTGHFYDVVTHGFGAMQDYSAQVSPRDRWAIIAYIRALQLSQHATAADEAPRSSSASESPAAQMDAPAPKTGGAQ